MLPIATIRPEGELAGTTESFSFPFSEDIIGNKCVLPSARIGGFCLGVSRETPPTGTIFDN